ncbi:alpha/beta hydrolase [Paralimibaculum aggregatum]|uniref:Alpha/beta hydrolase n=1 Tax=Paralimibaculum aggregatum TaxID=3036245 RepID=A0ABQ6LE68_9RHOB|nr:alpha/beta hydrolase [Limibaculum sp. NKW23]GMG81252.1 alpha/beta hydrolase [Limibaculum sp. NKW23]
MAADTSQSRAPSPFDPAAVEPETAAFNAALEAQLAELPRPMDLPVALTRRARAEGRGVFPLQGPRDTAHWVEDGPAGLRLTPGPGAPRGTYLHIHGGGWTFNAPEQYDATNRMLAEAAGCDVVSVRYRLGPEHRWPACAEDCLAAAQWVLETRPGPVVIGGESAGAHLALVTLLALRDAGRIGRVAGAALSYGMYDLRGTPSLRNWGERYLILSTPVVDWFVGNLMGGRERGDPAASPLLADLAGLPPALLQVGTADPLLDDSLFLAARLEAAGGAAELQVAPGGVHAFDQFDLGIARKALAARAGFLKARLAAG